MTSNEPLINFNDTRIAYQSKSKADLKRARFLYRLLKNPLISSIGQNLMKFSVKIGLPVNGLIKATLYKQFIGGETLEDCEKLAEYLAQYNVNTILDYAMEGEDEEDAFQRILNEFIRNIDHAAGNPQIPASVFKPSAIAPNAILERLSNPELTTEEDQQYLTAIRNRFETIFQRAWQKGVPVMVDAEESWIQDIIDSLVMEMMQRYNEEKPIVVNTYQLYRKDRLDVLKTHYEQTKRQGIYFGAKLVRGAYLEQERDRAQKHGYHSPVHDTKAATDKDYDEAVQFCIDHSDSCFTMVASHNEESNRLGVEQLVNNNLDKAHPHVWFSQLYGMADHITYNLAQYGCNVAKYIPYGPVKAVVPYLVRRAEENSSVQSQVDQELEGIEQELKRR